MNIRSREWIRKEFKASRKTLAYIADTKEALRDPAQADVERIAAERGVNEKVARAILGDPTDDMLAVIMANENCSVWEAWAYWNCPADCVVIRQLAPLGIAATISIDLIYEIQTDRQMQQERIVEYLDIHSRLHADEMEITAHAMKKDDDQRKRDAQNGKWRVFNQKIGGRDDGAEWDVEYKDGVRIS